MSPQRIQMTRHKPWRADHPEAVIVARPSKWGNPIRVDREQIDGRWMWRVHGSPMDRNGGPAYNDLQTARHSAVRYFEWDLLNGRFGDTYPSVDQIKAELAGRDLACWCPIRHYPNGRYRHGECHADILLDIADPDYAVPQIANPTEDGAA